MKPKISIILPFYNAGKFIENTIQSILDQTFKAYELILIDDGSTDDSINIIKHLLTTGGGVKLLSQKNKGVSSARNYGLSVAAGKWIAFIDSDDLLAPDYLEKLYAETVLFPKADLIQSGIINLYENGKKNVEQEYIDQISNDNLFIFSQVRGLLHSKLFNCNLIQDKGIRFNEKLRLCEDIVFTTQYLSYTKSVRFSSYKGYYYRRHTTSATGGNRIYPFDVNLETANSVAKSYRDYCSIKCIDIPNKHKRIIANKYWAVIFSLYKGMNKQNVRLNVLNAIVNDENKCFLKLLNSSKIQRACIQILFFNKRLFDTFMYMSEICYQFLKIHGK